MSVSSLKSLIIFINPRLKSSPGIWPVSASLNLVLGKSYDITEGSSSLLYPGASVIPSVQMLVRSSLLVLFGDLLLTSLLLGAQSPVIYTQ